MPEVDGRQSPVESLRLTRVGSWELPQEADVVLEKDLDIVDAVFEHCQAVDADTEGESADSFGVIVHETVDGRIEDRKSTRLNSSHGYISYAVFCLKKKKPRRRCSSCCLYAHNNHV